MMTVARRTMPTMKSGPLVISWVLLSASRVDTLRLDVSLLFMTLKWLLVIVILD